MNSHFLLTDGMLPIGTLRHSFTPTSQARREKAAQYGGYIRRQITEPWARCRPAYGPGLEKQHVLGAFLSCLCLFFEVKSSFKLRVFQGQNDGFHNLLCCHKAYQVMKTQISGPISDVNLANKSFSWVTCTEQHKILADKATPMPRESVQKPAVICTAHMAFSFRCLLSDDLSSFLRFVKLLITLLFRVTQDTCNPTIITSLSFCCFN
ncbi:hypothetical protein C4D60_Mb08t23440 [Musa balbisiana]|uniref:Uncharacterized protein n=1 Tax=Musa balbisiana TaxID=52838 RepID=A0A4S8K5Y4_MUSBA|nr:hypothetical protein C4D60_Mb08t23440 [Musa balbisiana]